MWKFSPKLKDISLMVWCTLQRQKEPNMDEVFPISIEEIRKCIKPSCDSTVVCMIITLLGHGPHFCPRLD
jgi:hypothetical protein